MNGGRPLRFLAVVIGGWTALRALALWPAADPVTATADRAGVPTAAAAKAEAPHDPPSPLPRVPLGVRYVRIAATRPVARPPAAAVGTIRFLPATLPIATTVQAMASPPHLPPPLAPVPFARGSSRLAGSAWLVARGSGGGDALSTSQLGASQAGARLTYALGSGRRAALSARIAAPLAGSGAEAGIGIDWQPGAAPIHLLVERRIALDRGRGGFAALVVGGIGPVEPIRGVRLEAYGQAGAVRRDRVEGFADGAARITHPIAARGGARIDLGAGAWGGAQRGARRLDLGPTIGLAAPVAGRSLRLTLDWRQRVAGNARPGSGPALSLGTDF